MSSPEQFAELLSIIHPSRNENLDQVLVLMEQFNKLTREQLTVRNELLGLGNSIAYALNNSHSLESCLGIFFFFWQRFENYKDLHSIELSKTHVLLNNGSIVEKKDVTAGRVLSLLEIRAILANPT